MKRKNFIKKQCTSLIQNRINYLDYYHVYIDTKDDIKESIKTDNYVIVPFIKKKEKAYLEVNTGNSKVDETIKAYLKLFFDEKSENQADFVISIGRNTSKFNSLNDYTKNNLKWYYDKSKNAPYFNGRAVGFTAYSGLVGRFFTNGSIHIFAYGKNIEGDIAAVKKLVSAKNILLTKDPFNVDFEASAVAKFTLVIDERDVTGLAVMDLMHRGEAHSYYNAKSGTNGERFKEIVEKILLDNNFEIAIKTVQTTSGTSYGQNTTLRLKNVNSDFSTAFKDAITSTAKPVVFSGGLFSDLFRWEEDSGLAIQLAQQGRDSWEIELTGGPTTECSTCPNYKYEDLVDYYWPALIAGVQKYSGQNKIDYVAHSNGCRVGLDSLKNWSNGKNNAGYYFDTSTGTYLITDLSSNPVDNFVGLGCPGAFEGKSFFSKFFARHGDRISDQLLPTHISGKEMGKKLAQECKNESGHEKLQCTFIANKLKDIEDNKISKNLALDYLNFVKSNTDSQPGGSNLQINKIKLIYSSLTKKATIVVPVFSDEFDQDGVVFSNDSIKIANNIISNNQNKTEKFQDLSHTSLIDNKHVQESIRRFLK